MGVTNFMSYADASQIVTKIGQKLAAVNGAYVFRGSVTFANLPSTPTQAMLGYTYNVTDDFTTDARFIEGSGKKYSAGTNVAVADASTYAAATPAGSENPSTEGWYEFVGGAYVLSTDTAVDSGKTYYVKTEITKFDVTSAFVDVDAIEAEIGAVSGSLADEFDDTETYAIGDIVVYEHALYRFKAAHAAGDWDSSEVDATTVESLVSAAEPDSLTPQQIAALLALLD